MVINGDLSLWDSYDTYVVMVTPCDTPMFAG